VRVGLPDRAYAPSEQSPRAMWPPSPPPHLPGRATPRRAISPSARRAFPFRSRLHSKSRRSHLASADCLGQEAKHE
jgi:hypothetical protein